MAEAKKRVIWSPAAREDYRALTEHLLDAWPDEVAERFNDTVLRLTELDEFVVILNLLDTRQN